MNLKELSEETKDRGRVIKRLLCHQIHMEKVPMRMTTQAATKTQGKYILNVLPGDNCQWESITGYSQNQDVKARFLWLGT